MVHAHASPPAGRGRDPGQDRQILDQGHSGRARGAGEQLPRGGRRQGMGRDQGVPDAQDRMVRRQAAVPSRSSTTTSARRRCASARTSSRWATSARRSRPAARVSEAEYEWPFQSHACMGPACAVVEIKDGHVTCWSGSQKPHFVRDGIAATLDLPVDKVDCIWVVGPIAAATTPTTARWTPPCSPRRSAVRCGCNTCASRAPAGTRRARPRSTAPARRSTLPARSSPMSS